MTAPLSVTVVVCTYTDLRWSLLARAMESLRDQTVPPSAIVLVVDHADALLERARSCFPWATVVPNTGRRGLSDGRNTGLSLADTDVVAFLDDDAVPEPDWLEELIGPYADESVLAVGGRTAADWQQGRPAWFPEEFDWVVGCTYAGARSDAGPVRNMLGANMSFRTSLLRRVDGFDASLGRVGTVPLGCEETEMCLRVQRSAPSGRIWYQPSAVVHHHVPSDRGQWRYFRSRCWSEGLSKARLSTLAGSSAALASERRYVRVALPRAVARDVGAAVSRRDLRHAVRAGAVAAGLATTGAGYLRGRWAERAVAGASTGRGRGQP